MPVPLAHEELIIAALMNYLRGMNGFTCNIVMGWVGNEEFQGAVLSLESLSSVTDFENARVEKFSVPEESEPPVTDVVLDYGRAIVPLTANLYVRSESNGKTERSKLLRQIRNAFAPKEPGVAAGVILTLANAEETRVRITLEDAQANDAAEGIRRDEWRAILKFEAMCALETTIQKPFCREIQIGDIEENLTAINLLTES